MLPLMIFVQSISRSDRTPQILIACFLFLCALPKPDVCMVKFGNVFRDCGMYARAEHYYAWATDYNGRCFDAWLNLSFIMAARGDARGTAQACNGAMQSSPPDIDSFCKLVLLRGTCGDFVRDAWMYKKGLQTDRNDADGWFSLGTQLAAAGDVKGAELAFKRVTDLKPYSSQAWLSLGNAVFSPYDSIASYDRALRLKPNFAEAWCSLGTVLIGIDNQQAEQSLLNAIYIEPAYCQAWHELGIVRRLRGDAKAAEDAFGKANKCGWKQQM